MSVLRIRFAAINKDATPTEYVGLQALQVLWNADDDDFQLVSSTYILKVFT